MTSVFRSCIVDLLSSKSNSEICQMHVEILVDKSSQQMCHRSHSSDTFYNQSRSLALILLFLFWSLVIVKRSYQRYIHSLSSCYIYVFRNEIRDIDELDSHHTCTNPTMQNKQTHQLDQTHDDETSCHRPNFY